MLNKFTDIALTKKVARPYEYLLGLYYFQGRGLTMKPKIGRIIFIIYDEQSIIQTTVFALGKDCFFDADYAECYDIDNAVFKYDDYNKTWFTSLIKAKKRLLEVAYKEDGEKLKIEKMSDGYWEVISV